MTRAWFLLVTLSDEFVALPCRRMDEMASQVALRRALHDEAARLHKRAAAMRSAGYELFDIELDDPVN